MALPRWRRTVNACKASKKDQKKQKAECKKGYVGSLGDKPKRSVVEIKGRFSVTSENVDLAKVQEVPTSSISHKLQEGSALRKSASVGHWPVDAKPMSNSHHRKELCNGSVSASILIPHLRNLVQHTTFQQDLITNLLSSLQQNEKADATQYRLGTMGSDTGVETSVSDGERSLLVKIFELQSRMISLTDELITTKLKHAQDGSTLVFYTGHRGASPPEYILDEEG